ncbi:MAG: hypothetical protein QXD48_02055 [Candidatus Aenigmatarchaeota archaeon]
MITKDKKIIYIEPGAGLSTKYLFEELDKRKFDLEKIFSYLLEPSAERLKIASDYLRSLNLKEGKNFIAITGKNYDIQKLITSNTVDVIGSVATDHHEPE